jgi:hypothetical protein
MLTNWMCIAMYAATEWESYQLLMYDLRWARRKNMRIYFTPLHISRRIIEKPKQF